MMPTSYGLNVAEADKDLHPVFKTDPSQLWNLINKKVSLSTIEGLQFDGWVYTIDPVTHNWVLFTATDNGNTKIQLVMNASVTDVRVADDVCPDFVLTLMANYGETKKVPFNATQVAERRDAVCRWFGVNRIPVTKSGEMLSVADDAVMIDPPYQRDNCYSSNEIILSRVRTLLASLPSDDNMNLG